MSPRAYRDREANVSLLQRCWSGGGPRLTASTVCTDTPTIWSGWRLYGMVFNDRTGLTNACVSRTPQNYLGGVRPGPGVKLRK
eukprot:1710085-Prymnesium_polylepis.1